MMIRINLLPDKRPQKREQGKQYFVALVCVLIVALIGNAYWYYTLDSERKDKQRSLNDTNSRIAQLERVIGEVNNLNRRKKEVEDKLAVLDRLRKKRGGPVKLLDALATCVPKHVWLTRFSEKEGKATISGQADSFEDVSEFMRGLNSMTWTSNGMGRVIDINRNTATARVELLTESGSIKDFPVADLGFFFKDVELKNSQTTSQSANLKLKKDVELVRFEMNLIVNYTI